MDALTLITQNLDVERILRHYDFDKIKPDGGGFIRSCCKLHGGNNPTSFVINAENGIWYCHTGGCGGGSIYQLVEKLEGIGFMDAVRKVAKLVGVDIDNMEILEHKASYMEDVKTFLDTMRPRIKKKKEAYTIQGNLRDVTKFRDFNISTLQHFGLKYVEKIHLLTREGKPYTLSNRLLFPITFKHVLCGVSLRRIKASDNPKWLHQPVNIDTHELLYNYDACINATTITVVEGIVDVWAYHEIGITAVATFGAHLTNEQYRLLMRTGADLVWSYDGDEAGRLALKKASDQFRFKANQFMIHFDDGEDPASISREELKKRYEERRKV
jgi:DNA primase